MPERLYFAYGSNINLDQMERRCPNAEVVAPVTLNGYRLLFRGHSPGNGVATIASDSTKQVKGLLWKLTPECEQSLDHYEGFPHFYGKETVNVMDKAGNAYSVMVYVMTPEYAKYVAFPSMSYYMGIAEGYKQNGIPLKGLSDAINYCRKEVNALEFGGQRSVRSDKKPKSYER